ncbi:MAG: HIT family protein [bacterium]|nr:HIT family protein [bacterium]
MECYSCKSISGEKRLSPGPTIYESEYWYLEHAYPCALKGWLVLVLKRHVEALDKLDKDEFSELGRLQEKTIKILKQEMNCEKEYVMCLAEHENFRHIHVHIIAKPDNLPAELTGAKIFAMLKPEQKTPLPPEQVKELCGKLRDKFLEF